VKGDIMVDTMTKNDVERAKGLKIKRLENLAKACAEATSDEMKKMWFDKLIDLAKKYDMRDYVMRRLVH
tara:strand:- start:285 stop:491 length:207 start_codon:yes stop_codon:yes gene_type:complete